MTRIRATLVALTISAAAAGTAQAHLERPSYWPDPAPDTSVTPPAGGKVPKAKSLASAVAKSVPTSGDGEVRVVCQDNSLKLAIKSINAARKKGYRLRPSQPKTKLSKKQAKTLIAINKKLKKKCAFETIQPAIDASGNNDRVVIMPGLYTEPESRAAPVNDPKCNPSMLQKDASGDFTPSYKYQVNCPHDQNLIYIQGREVKGEPLAEPRSNRQGIPEQELGACARCNFQLEGSGAKPSDVIMDAGTEYVGKGAEARPSGHAKDVVLRADRTDGFVGRNFTVRGAKEHGFYTEETDGTMLDRVYFYWNADYGHLAFTSDHQLIQNCDAMGAGDAGLYPGAAPETGAQATAFYPDAPRMNTTIRKCDMRNNTLGYSGSMGNAVRITNNHIYGNTTGVASDTLSSAGHPGYPADSSTIDHNFFYANNFNTYTKKSPVDALVTVPIGNGIIYAGMNSARVHDNWFFDNWRYATMLFAVPDQFTSFGGAEGDVFPGVACPTPETGVSTSCDNHFYNNKMGQVPKGFRFPSVLEKYGVPHSPVGQETMRNAVDFWWDQWSGNTANCWFDNTGFDGRKSTITGTGPAGDMPAGNPQPLPNCSGGEDPSSSLGMGDPAKTVYLITCSDGPTDTETGERDGCDWYSPPAKPGGKASRRHYSQMRAWERSFNESAAGARMRQRIAEVNATPAG
jgi:hypothetical protein